MEGGFFNSKSKETNVNQRKSFEQLDLTAHCFQQLFLALTELVQNQPV